MIASASISEVEKELHRLKKTLEDAGIYFIHEDGQLLSCVGVDEKAAEDASILASWFSAAKMLFSKQRNDNLKELGQWGDNSCIFSFPVDKSYLLTVKYHGSFKYPGWVLMKCRSSVEKLREIVKSSDTSGSGKLLFENISDGEIDDLFGGV